MTLWVHHGISSVQKPLPLVPRFRILRCIAARWLADLLGWRRMAQQLRQFGEVSRHPPRLVAREPLGRRAALRFIVEIKIAERLSVRVLHDEGFGVLFDRPRQRKAARSRLRYSSRAIEPASSTNDRYYDFGSGFIM